MDKELSEKLIKKYPTVFRQIYGDPRETCMAWGICTGNGWYDILDELCAVLEENGIVAAQIKEKFGGLRFYTGGVPSEKWDIVEAAIRKAESASYKTCENCGKPGELRGGGWARVKCDDCENCE